VSWNAFDLFENLLDIEPLREIVLVQPGALYDSDQVMQFLRERTKWRKLIINEVAFA
jgi:hypothetical protein